MSPEFYLIIGFVIGNLYYGFKPEDWLWCLNSSNYVKSVGFQVSMYLLTSHSKKMVKHQMTNHSGMSILPR